MWRQTIRQRRALMLGLKLIGIEHAQDHEALEETLAENEQLRALIQRSHIVLDDAGIPYDSDDDETFSLPSRIAALRGEPSQHGG